MYVKEQVTKLIKGLQLLNEHANIRDINCEDNSVLIISHDKINNKKLVRELKSIDFLYFEKAAPYPTSSFDFD